MPEPFRGRPAQLWLLLKNSVTEAVEDRITNQAAALTYYALFAIGPLLLIAVSLAGLVFGESDARRAVTSEVGRLLGPKGQEAITSLMEGSERDGSGIAGLVLGSLALVVGAMAAFRQLREGLNWIWEVAPKPLDGWRRKALRFLRQNLVGTAAALGTGFLLLVSLALSAVLAAAAEQVEQMLPWDLLSARAVHLVATLIAATLVFALMFRYLADARIAWKDVAIGACTTAVLFVVGEIVIGLYIGQTATASRYGAAGAVLVIILWVYYSNLILFIGAEITQVYANRHGQGVRPTKEGIPLREALAGMEGPRKAGRPRAGAPRKAS